MTDSSANPRNYGERPLHEDDPLMELSRIMDFGASAETNPERSEQRSEPNFDSGDDALSFDLEREMLGDFDDFSEPQHHVEPFAQSPAYTTDSYQPVSQNSELQLSDDDLAFALEDEFELQLDANEPLVSTEPFEFVEADRSEPIPQFDYNAYSEANTAYGSAHPVNELSAPEHQNLDDYASSAYQPLVAPYGDAYATESDLDSAPLAASGNDWETPYAEPARQPLSLEDELESLLFGDEPQPAYDNQPAQTASYAPRYEETTIEAPSYIQPAQYGDVEPAFDNFQLQDPQAYEPAIAAESFAPESYRDAYDAAQSDPQAQAAAYPHYTLSNFASGSAAAGVLSSEPVEVSSAFNAEQAALDDFSFGDDFSFESEQNLTPVAVEATDDDLSGLDDMTFNDDDFGFEASGDAASHTPAQDPNIFSEDDFFIEEDLDLSPESAYESVYAHATLDEHAQTSAPSFTNYADPRSAFAAPAPEIETLNVSDSKVEQTHSLDLPDVNYGDDDSASSLTDLEAEFAEVFSTVNVDEPATKIEAQSDADKAFEDIFREGAASYMPNQSVVAGAALGAGAAMAYGRSNASVQSATSQSAVGNSDDFYNHWAAQGAQTMESGEFGARAEMQPEDDLGSAAEAYRSRPVRGRRGLILASVAGLAVLVGGIGYHFVGGSGSGEPVVIRADDQPIKVQPTNPGGATVPNQDKAVYDRVAGTLPNTPEQKSLISSGEEPVDLGAQDNDVAANDFPEPNQAPEASSNPTQNAPLIQTREVQTMIVRPDGTIVQSEQPSSSPQQAAATNDSAPIAPPAETDEIAALAGGGEQQVPVQAPITNPTPAQPVAQAPVAPVRAPIVASRPAEQPTTIVGNVAQRMPAETPAAAAPVAQQVASAAGGGYFIQIASQPSAELAQKSYANMAQRYGSVIGGRAVDIKRADIPNKGTYYRVRVQAGSKDEANALCGRFKTAGGSCFVTQ